MHLSLVASITTGIGSQGRCVGNTGAITRLGFEGELLGR